MKVIAQSVCFVVTFPNVSHPVVLCTVLVAGLWLAVVETLPTKKGCRVSNKVDVQFGYAYYILLVSGLFSLGGAAFNLLFARSAADRRRAMRNRIR